MIAALAAALAGAGVAPAAARPIPPGPTVDLGSVAQLTPDGSALHINLNASCPQRWTVIEATVSVSQPEASGEGSFSLRCTGGLQPATATVVSSGEPFVVGQADATAVLVIERGRTERAEDSAVVRVVPGVVVHLPATATITAGGYAVLVDVTVACSVGADPRQSYATITQSPVVGRGTFVPICDGQPHVFGVSTDADQGTFEVGLAQGNAFAVVEEGGDLIFGEDNREVQIVAP